MVTRFAGSRDSKKAFKFEEQKLVDASTVHIDEGDTDVLNDLAGQEAWPMVVKYREGYFVHVGCADVWRDYRDAGASALLQALIQRAEESGATFLRLDADGAVYDELPRGVWK